MIDYCKFCGQKIAGKKHENICPYNDAVLREIILYLIDYFVKNSKFNKHFRPFPTIKEFQSFLKSKKLMGLKTIRRHYFEDDMKLEDFLSELIEMGVHKRVIDDIEFPDYLRFAYDGWLFYNNEEYGRLYREAIDYEDSEYTQCGIMSDTEGVGFQMLYIEAPNNQRKFKT